MSNWTSINETMVRTGKLSVFMNAMQARAAAASEANPLPNMISGVVSRIRRAIVHGNVLDVDPTKIPNSLVDLATRLIQRRIKSYLNQELTKEESAQADDDRADLNQIVANKTPFETPDVPAGDAEMQSGGGLIDTVTPGNSGNSRDDTARL
jgi:hypothetical protein